jgi:2-oxoglutarate ferredoxin oxidoreductase subunit delta
MKFWRTPLDLEKQLVPRGDVHILRERCKGCGFCVEYCPEKVLAFSKLYNKKGYYPPEVVPGKECVACKFCELLCPDFAIFITEKEKVAAEVNRGEG